MSLRPGVRLGSYVVTRQIGAGGMGEVYHATDTKLGRDVAIKVLPTSLARDVDRLARFEREARVLASLNHPNIATVHGLEGDGGTTALVMEFVEGVTLADRITKGPIPGREALSMARQIADALEAAHERGVVHRDLKPGNVMIRPDGTVKVLDFGLAKDLRAGSAGSGSDSATITAVTEAGLVVGTPAYMSPEQARGDAVDRRTDIWAFGCVLFEMLTRRRAFGGTSSADIIASVLTREVEWSTLPADVPPAVRHLLSRCLARDPRQRLRDIGEARLILENPAALPVPVEGPSRRWTWGRAAWVAIVALLAGGLVGGLVAWRLAPDASPGLVTRTSIALAEGQDFTYPGRRFIAISPMGTQVAYTAGPGLWLRPLAEADAELVPGVTGDPRSPFFSADGLSLGYYATGGLWRVSLTGGAPTRLVDAVNPWGASWGADGTILYGQGPDGIWRVSDAGGAGKQVIAAGEGETLFGPQLLPGGEWVLFSTLPAGVGLWDQGKIVVQSLVTGERVTLVNGGRAGRYLSTGHLVYALRDTLLAAPFDVATRTLAAAAAPVANGVADAQNITGAAHFDISETGTLVYAPRALPDRLSLTWVDRAGREEAIPAEPRAYRNPRASRDGQRLSVEVLEVDGAKIWIGDARGAFAPLTAGEGNDRFPTWSPDGSRLVFSSTRNGGGLVSRLVGGTSDTLLVKGVEWMPSSWTADGRLVYEQLRGAQIEVLGAGPATAAQSLTLVNSPAYFDVLHPAISPDGRWVAHHSTESGQAEVYVRPFPNVNDNKWLVSKGGGYSPVWSPDGRELYYIQGVGQTRPARMPDGYLMAVDVRMLPTVTPGPPERLFSMRDFVAPTPQGREYDIAPDGRFLMLKDATPGGVRAGAQVAVVQHWFDDLRVRVPTNR